MLKLSIFVFGVVGLGAGLPIVVSAAIDCNNPQTTQEAIQCGASNSAGVPVGTDANTSLDNTITKGINLLSLVIGIVAVVMIMLGGFRYVASGGKQESVASAKNTIVYAIIGLVIVAMAQIVVHFVLNKTDTATTCIPKAGQTSC